MAKPVKFVNLFHSTSYVQQMLKSPARSLRQKPMGSTAITQNTSMRTGLRSKCRRRRRHRWKRERATWPPWRSGLSAAIACACQP